MATSQLHDKEGEHIKDLQEKLKAREQENREIFAEIQGSQEMNAVSSSFVDRLARKKQLLAEELHKEKNGSILLQEIAEVRLKIKQGEIQEL